MPVYPLFQQLDEVLDMVRRQMALPDRPHVEIEVRMGRGDGDDDDALIRQVQRMGKQ